MKFILGFCQKKKKSATNSVHNSTYFLMIKYLKSPSLLEPIHKTKRKEISFSWYTSFPLFHIGRDFEDFICFERADSLEHKKVFTFKMSSFRNLFNLIKLSNLNKMSPVWLLPSRG